jgi:hypothetical protein
VGYVASDEDDDHSWSREAHGLRARAGEALRRVEEEAKSYYDSLKRGLSSGASGARDFAAERASVVSSFASDLKERFSAGLDNLPPESRDRVIRAREQAYGAMLKAEQLGRDAWRNPGQTLEDHPLVAGAIGFAVGRGGGRDDPLDRGGEPHLRRRARPADGRRRADAPPGARARACRSRARSARRSRPRRRRPWRPWSIPPSPRRPRWPAACGERAKDEIAGAQGSSGSAIG